MPNQGDRPACDCLCHEHGNVTCSKCWNAHTAHHTAQESAAQIVEQMNTPLDTIEPATSFLKELTHLLNRYSKENDSNTPDFILAEHLVDCLTALNRAIKKRSGWYGDGQKAYIHPPVGKDAPPRPRP